MDHCVEGLCSPDSKAGVESDGALDAGLRLLVRSLLRTKGDWEDEGARLESMLGVVESMKGVGFGIPMGGSHGIGHQLGPLGVGHGGTCFSALESLLIWDLTLDSFVL